MVLLAAIDQGTSSSRFLVFDADTAEVVASAQKELVQSFPHPGWVEMCPEAIVQSVEECIVRVCSKLGELGIPISEIKSIGVANQRETTIVWDRQTGKALHPALVWLDMRTAELAEIARKKTENNSKDAFKTRTGLPIHPYFSALKLVWLLQNVPAVKQALDDGRLMAGTVDAWLAFRLTGQHVTDVTNASRTLLFDLNNKSWSEELCSFFDVPSSILPRVVSSAEIVGHLTSGPLKGVPVSALLGDQQAALVGHRCLEPGQAKNTYGTGTFMLCTVGSKPVVSRNGLLTTVAFQFGPTSEVCYALEGSGSMGGNAVRFLRDNFGFIKDACEVEKLAEGCADTGGVAFVPSFSGLYSPYWDSTARGTICGMTQSTTKSQICRAALEAVAFQSAELVEAIEHDMDGGTRVNVLKVDGGMTANRLFVQLQADILGRPVEVPPSVEISGWGAALAGGVGAQLISLEHITYPDKRARAPTPAERFESRTDAAYRRKAMARWRRAVERARAWAVEEEEEEELEEGEDTK